MVFGDQMLDCLPHAGTTFCIQIWVAWNFNLNREDWNIEILQKCNHIVF